MADKYPIRIEIEPGIHLIRGKNRSRFPEANCILIDDEILTLIDAGADIDHIRHALQSIGYELEHIKRIVISHFHIDHKGYAEIIRAASNCEVLCNPQGVDATRSFEGLVKCYGHRHGEHYDAWERFLRMFAPHSMEDYSVTGTFRDRGPIDCGSHKIIPIFTPGHTHDHTCFGIDGTDLVYLVDIDLTRFGPWYGNIVSDISQFRKSVDVILAEKPTVGISGHLMDPVSNDLIERLERYRRVFDERDERILKSIQEGHNTVDRLTRVPIIYPSIPHEAYLTFEKIMIEKHITLLQAAGRVAMRDGVLEVVNEGQ